MKPVILLTSDQLYPSTQALLACLERAGHQVTCLNPARASITGHAPEPGSVILPRLGSRNFDRAVAFMEHLIALGAVSLQPSEALRRCRRKSSLLLAPPPGVEPAPSRLVRNSEEVVSALDALGGFPVVAKPDRGSQGSGVLRLADVASVHAYAAVVRSMEEDLLLQPYFAGAEDVRALVVGDRCIAAMSRIPAKDDFRANLHRGATGRPLDPEGPWAAPALAVTEALGLSMAGVDFLKVADSLMLMEVNGSPGLSGIQAVTGVDGAKAVVALCGKV